jgi:hypothetical protein
VARQPAGRDLRGRVVGRAREGVELGPIVRDEQRERLGVGRIVGPPHGDVDLGPQRARSDAEPVRAAGSARRIEPGGRHVARELHDRLLAERAGRAQRVGVVGHVGVAAVLELDVERVLEARERRRGDRQRPVVAVAYEAIAVDREAAIGGQAHAGQPRVLIGQAEADAAALDERACGGGGRRHRAAS